MQNRLMHPSDGSFNYFMKLLKIYIIYWYSSHDRICAEKNKPRLLKCLKANMETMKC